MLALFSNTASATLASSISTSSTAITVSTGMGVMFPTITADTFFMATLTDSSNNLEIVKVTNRVADVLTVVRAQEGTTARAYAAGDKIELRIPASILTGFAQLDGTQTFIGNKTFTGTNTFSGVNTVSGTLTFSGAGAFIAPLAAAPAQTAEGSVVWDSNDDLLTVGTGTVRKTMVDTDSTQTLTNKTLAAVTLTGNINLAGNALATTAFTIQEVGGVLVFKNGATKIATLSSAGIFTALGDVTSDSALV